MRQTVTTSEITDPPMMHDGIDRDRHANDTSTTVPTEAPPHPTDATAIPIEFSQFFIQGPAPGCVTASDVPAASAYVERLTPVHATHGFPIVLIHGGFQTGASFTGTPDGRRGWAHDFLRAGYEVYIIDQTGCGRSGDNSTRVGGTDQRTVRQIEISWTDVRSHRLWPRAHRHTQWPGTGRQGDPVFDRFLASQVPMCDRAVAEASFRSAGARLLDRIGPAVLLTHSQSAALGWGLTEERPQLIKAIIAVEPGGPPFRNLDVNSPGGWNTYHTEQIRPWGLTRLPLTFEPPAPTASDLIMRRHEALLGEDLVSVYLQAEPARTLPKLSGIPVLVVTGEASSHSHYDHATVAFLTQAGVSVDHLRLECHGIHGNCHMMMLEKNNHEIADVLIAWIGRTVDACASVAGC